jgi:hypothetical protein
LKKSSVKNSAQMPRIYFGLHMVEGVAEYREPDQEPYRILVGESAIKNMDPSFQGKPVYVEHVEEVNLKTLQEDADGYVIRSFFNPADGKHWAEFIVVSDRGHQAISGGMRLSNAYIPSGTYKAGGQWHGVDYEKEITDGEYEHLAIVSSPRYDESIILTPEEFKQYNEDKQTELKRIANSKKGDPKMKFNLFKKTKVENSIDIEGMMIELPTSKKELALTKVINEYDKIINMNGYASGDHMVKVGDKDEMSVNDLFKKYKDMSEELNAMKKKNDDSDDTSVDNDDDDSVDNDDDDSSVDNDDDGSMDNDDDSVDNDDDGSMDNDDDDVDDKKKSNKKKSNKKKNSLDKKKEAIEKKANFESLKNASKNIIREETPIDLAQDKLARGQSRYGSGR